MKQKTSNRPTAPVSTNNTPHASANIPNQPLSFLNYKSLLLSVILIVTLVLLKNMQPYSNFFESKIKGGYEEMNAIKEVDNYTDVEFRKKIRWGEGYFILQQLKQRINDKNAIVLVPPIGYFNAINPKMMIPEPSIAYYYTGLKTTWGNTPYAYKSNYAFVINKLGADVMKLNSRKQIDSLLTIYKPYPYTL